MPFGTVIYASNCEKRSRSVRTEKLTWVTEVALAHH